MGDIIETQQEDAKSAERSQPFDMQTLVEDALRIQSESIRKREVKVEKNYNQHPVVFACVGMVIGVYGVSTLMVLSTAAILVAIMTRGRQQIIAVTLVLLPGLLGAILKNVDWTEPDGDPLTATIIQGGISQDRKWLPEQFRPTLD